MNSDTKDTEKKPLSLGGGKGTLTLKPGNQSAPNMQIRQSLSQGRGRAVAVEVRRKRGGADGQVEADQTQPGAEVTVADHHLTNDERDARIKALQKAIEDEEKRKVEDAARREQQAHENVLREQEQSNKPMSADELREREVEELKRIEEDEKRAADLAEKQRQLNVLREGGQTGAIGKALFGKKSDSDEDEEETVRAKLKRAGNKAPSKKADDEIRWTGGKLTVNQVINEVYDRDSGRSLASMRRARAKAKASSMSQEPAKKINREVIVPEVITVQELANRMAERSGDVIKALMKMGVMATINQTIDPDTAELLISEFGHTIKRVTEADVEIGIEGIEDSETNMVSRPPVVTIMGHVDHGKTSLLDAMRSTNVVSGEAGGITQHIGAYQVTLPSGAKITFLDTPGHAAFSEMRARGANVTDIVVLVVAANDSIMPQTIEAINHAKAAKVPLIVAINKIDLPDADTWKVKQDLLSHEVIVEELSGEVQCVELSAKKKMNLDKLEEAILLQAEILNLKANPDRDAVGRVIEAKMEQGRGSVATVLIQKGTLKLGDVFVVGAEYGRVRALIDDRGQNIKSATIGQPVEVLGLTGTPDAGDSFTVLKDETKAREIAGYRARKKRDLATTSSTSGMTFDQILAQSKVNAGRKELAVIIKADVHGSVEAIVGSLAKISDENQEISVRVLHSGVGGITESDITLAKASNALVIGFNVRANAQARDQAAQNKVNMRYYNIIYNVIDDVKGLLSGLLSPALREEYLGQAEIRQVFNITKVGKVGGCMVTTGVVKRGSKVRLLRDSVVIHEGTLKTLKRFKDEVKEVKEGTECGMAFENYDDIKEKDIIECYDVISEARSVT